MNNLEIKDRFTDTEHIAKAMLSTRGDLAKVSRLPEVRYNAMVLRSLVREHPEIRRRYHELLAEELQNSGIHISERILAMVELQKEAFGGEIIDSNGEVIELPADPMTAIKLSREISTLIAEGRQMNMSGKNAVIIASKEDAEEILKQFLES